MSDHPEPSRSRSFSDPSRTARTAADGAGRTTAADPRGLPARTPWASLLLTDTTGDADPRLRTRLRALASNVRLWLMLAAVVVGAAALTAAMAWQGGQAAARERAASARYAHTLEVLIEIGGFSAAVREAEGAARGYLLSRDPRFLAAHAEGARATPEHLRRLRELTSDNPAQQARLARLSTDADAVLGASRREIELETAGRRRAALAVARSGPGLVSMQDLQAMSAEVVAEEQRLLAVRRERAGKAMALASRVTRDLTMLGAALLVMAAGLGWFAFAADARARLAVIHAKANERLAATASLLSRFVEEAPAAIAMFDRQMRYLAASRRYAADYGLPADLELIGRSHYELFPDLPQRWRESHRRVLAGETLSCDEDPFPRPDGRIDWVRWRMEPWRDTQGEIGGALLFSEVITAELEALRAREAVEAVRQEAQRRELVVGELRHRLSNMFAVVRMLITATARSQHEVGPYRDALLARVSAFAATQIELARHAGSNSSLRDLVQFELQPYADANREVTLDGPDVELNGAAAQNVAMVIHELATNGAKHGALGRPGATLRVQWRLDEDAARGARLILEWLERLDFPVPPPARRGFGSTVIESCARALGGAAELAFAPEGLRCTIEFSASRALATAAGDPA